MKEKHSLEAIILRRWDYGDKDLIVSFLSKEKGRLQGIAKGAKVSLKRFGPALDLFCWVKLQVSERKNTSLYFIEEAQIISNFSKLREDYASILIASGLLDLSQQLYREGPAEEAAFTNLLESLSRLESEGAKRRVFWSFLIKNFEIMGWALKLQSCEKCGKNFGSENCFFDVIQGSGYCLECGSSSQNQFSVPSALANWIVNPKNECKFTTKDEELLQHLLEHHYQNHLHLLPDWNRFLQIRP